MFTRRFVIGLAGSVWLSLAAAGSVLAQEIVTTGPPPALRANVTAFVKAFNSGSSDEWEAMAKSVFTPAFFKKQTAAERKLAYTKMRAEFGTIAVDRVERQGGPDAPLQIVVKGSVASGTFWVDLDEASRFDSLKAEVSKQPDEGRRH
jgi:hypothetical protein